LGRIPDEEFEAALADRTAMPSTSGGIRATSDPKQSQCRFRKFGDESTQKITR
jgi:hypothetical protein